MKIVVDGTFVTPASGTFRYLTELVNALTGLQGEDEFVLLTSSATHDSVMDASNPAASLTIVNLGDLPTLGSKLRATRSWVRENSIAVLHSPGYFVASRSGVPAVVTVHDVNFVLRITDWIRAGNLMRALRLASHVALLCVTSDAVIVPSERTRRELLRFLRPLRRRVRVVPHGAHQVSGSAVAFRERSPLLLSVGVIAPQKNLETAIRAFGLARGYLPADAAYHIVGRDPDGYWASHLRPLVDSLGLSSAVIYLGQVSDDDLNHQYRTARGLVFLSRGEGYGLPAAEAVSQGLPVIASMTTAIGEAVNGCALLVDPDDFLTISSNIRGLLTDEALWMSESNKIARVRAHARTWADVARAHVDVYHSVGRTQP